MKKLYALLVGINQYQGRIPQLKGCTNDVKRVLAYLQNLSGFDLKEKILTDEAATKANIAEQFLQHLTQAGPDDVALFYFSGHGTREVAPAVFRTTATNDKLQSLVCYDSSEPSGAGGDYKLLANKELRYLIHSVGLKNPHFLTIFDCCHAGETTRGDEFVQRQFIPRLSTFAFPERPWDAFIFSKKFSAQDFADRPIDELLPEGKHISLAACLPTESAFEYRGSGAFTEQLLDVLQRSDNRISYYDLESRVRNMIKNHYKQTPSVYVSAERPREVFRFFLDIEASEGAPLYANLTQKNGGWFMDMGHLHGISPIAGKATVKSINDDEQLSARLGQILATETELLFDSPPQAGKIYKAFIESFFPAPLKIFFQVAAGNEAGWKSATDQLALAGKNVVVTEQEYEANYTILVANQQYTITGAEDHHRPRVLPTEDLSFDNVKRLMGYLKHISQWEFIKNLHNPKSWAFKDHPIQMEIFRTDSNGREEAVALNSEGFELEYRQQPGSSTGGSIRIKLTNTFDRPLFVSFLYLSMTFQSYTGFLPQPTYLLEPGANVWARERRDISLSLEKHVIQHNWPASTSYFKIIANTEFFDATRFELAALPGPFEGIKRAGRHPEDLPNPDAHDWTTRLITLRIPNPNYREEAIVVG